MMNVLLECDDWNVLLLLAGEGDDGGKYRPLDGRKKDEEGEEKDGLSLERLLFMRILLGDTETKQIRVRLGWTVKKRKQCKTHLLKR